MFSRVAKRVRRQSVQVVEAPAPEYPLPSGPPREVVDCAPDLLRSCNLETPFPSVAYGGYRKYYRTRESTKPDVGDSPNYSPRLSSLSSSSSNVTATPLFDSQSPSILPSITSPPMIPEPRTPRRVRRYSLSQVASEKIPILSRWKRTTLILTPDIIGSASTTTALDLIVRPPLDTSRSSSSSSSNRSTDSTLISTPDSVAFSQITQRNTADTPCCLQTPTTIYNDGDADIFIVGSRKKRFNGIELTLPRPDSSLSFWTAKSDLSEQYI